MKQWNHHQKGQGNDKHDYGAAKQISGSFVTLFISKHGTLDEHSKTKAVNAGLITTCWAPFNQLSLSARSPQCKSPSRYLCNKHPCELSSCKKYWTCLRVSDSMWFWGTHLQSPASPLIFAGSLWWFQHISTFGPKVPLETLECILLYEDAPPNTMGSRGYGSNLGPPKVGQH